MLAAAAERLRVGRARRRRRRPPGRRGVRADPAGRRRRGRRGLRRARAGGAGRADRPRAAAGRLGGRGGRAERRHRRRRAARERRRGAVLGQALGPRPDRAATCAARCAPRPSSATRSRRCWSAARSAIRSVFQPIVELATGRAGGYEALTRFDREPLRGPDEWFAQAHRVGLGEELEALALRAALAVPGRPDGTFLAVNVSPRALLSAPVREALPQDLSGIVDRADRARAVRRRGRARGRARRAARPRRARRARRRRRRLRGPAADHPRSRPTSSSSTARSSTARTPTASRQALLEALIGFAASTGAAVCAEGVEDLDDLRALVSLDVTYAQGYGLARPAAAWPAARRRGDRRRRRRDPLRPAHRQHAPRRRRRVRARPGRALRPPCRRHDARRPPRRERPRRGAAARRRGGADARRHEADELELLSPTTRNSRPATAGRSTTSRPPATCSTTASPARSSPATRRGDQAELAELEPTRHGDDADRPRRLRRRTLGVLEVYRVAAHRPSPRARSTARACSRSSSAPPRPPQLT